VLWQQYQVYVVTLVVLCVGLRSNTQHHKGWRWLLVMECIEYTVVNGQKGLLLACGLVRDITLFTKTKRMIRKLHNTEELDGVMGMT